jgi:hypothetical protein
LRGFCDCDAVETCGNTGEGVEATTAFDFPDRPPFLASLSALSLALRASLSVLALALSVSIFLWLRTLIFSFSGSLLMSTSTSSSCTSPWLAPKAAPYESASSQAFLASSSSTGQKAFPQSMYQQHALRCAIDHKRTRYTVYMH